MKNTLKKVLASFAVLGLAALMVGCSKNDQSGSAGGDTSSKAKSNAKLKIWTTSNAMKESAEKWADDADKKVEVVVIPYADFQKKLKQQVTDPATAPDVFISSRDYVKEWSSRKGVVLDLEKEFPADVKTYKKNAYADLVDLGSNSEGHLMATTGEYPVGMMFYNRTIAKEILGTDDPVKVAEAMDNVDKWQDVNTKIQAKYGNKVKLLGTLQDTLNMLGQQRTKPYVKNNVFTIDSSLSNLFDQAEIMYKNKMFLAEAENEAYQAGFNQSTFFANFLPSWGFSAKVRSQIEGKEMAGKWGMTLPTYNYVRGGSYFFITASSKNKANAWDYVKSQTVNTKNLVNDQKSKVGYPSSKVAGKELLDSGYEEPLLGDEKVYDLYYEQAGITEKNTKDIVTKYDGSIVEFINNLLYDFGAGNLSKKEALTELGNQVKTAYPELKVKNNY